MYIYKVQPYSKYQHTVGTLENRTCAGHESVDYSLPLQGCVHDAASVLALMIRQLQFNTEGVQVTDNVSGLPSTDNVGY